MVFNHAVCKIGLTPGNRRTLMAPLEVYCTFVENCIYVVSVSLFCLSSPQSFVHGLSLSLSMLCISTLWPTHPPSIEQAHNTGGWALTQLCMCDIGSYHFLYRQKSICTTGICQERKIPHCQQQFSISVFKDLSKVQTQRMHPF